MQIHTRRVEMDGVLSLTSWESLPFPQSLALVFFFESVILCGGCQLVAAQVADIQRLLNQRDAQSNEEVSLLESLSSTDEGDECSSLEDDDDDDDEGGREESFELDISEAERALETMASSLSTWEDRMSSMRDPQSLKNLHLINRYACVDE